MTLVTISQELHNRVQKAMGNPFRYERCQRFAMGEVLRAWERHSPVASVFVDTTRAALENGAEPPRLAPERKSSRLSAAA